MYSFARYFIQCRMIAKELRMDAFSQRSESFLFSVVTENNNSVDVFKLHPRTGSSQSLSQYLQHLHREFSIISMQAWFHCLFPDMSNLSSCIILCSDIRLILKIGTFLVDNDFVFVNYNHVNVKVFGHKRRRHRILRKRFVHFCEISNDRVFYFPWCNPRMYLFIWQGITGICPKLFLWRLWVVMLGIKLFV
jgi:hypothetical protein